MRIGIEKYRCNNGHCNGSIPVDEFDALILNGLKGLADNTEYFKEQKVRSEAQILQKAKLSYEITEAENRIKELDKRIAYLADLFVAGKISEETNIDQIAIADTEKNTLTAELREKKRLINSVIVYDDYYKFITEDFNWLIHHLYQFKLEAQAAILKSIISRIDINENTIEVHLKYIPGLRKYVEENKPIPPLTEADNILQVGTMSRNSMPSSLVIKTPPKRPHDYPKKVKVLGDLLRKTRHDKHLTQQEVADELKVDVNTLRGWESNRFVPRSLYWKQICEFIGDDSAIEKVLSVLKNKPYSIQMAAIEVGVTHWTIKEWIGNGKIKMPGRHPTNDEYVFSMEEIENMKLLNSHKT